MEYQINSLDHLTEKMMNAPAVKEFGICHNLKNGIVTPLPGEETINDVIRKHLEKNHRVVEVAGGYVFHDSEHIFKFRFVIFFEDDDGKRYATKCSVISDDLGALADYFGVDPFPSREGFLKIANETWGIV